MYWESLRKGTVIVHVEREHTNDTLFADNIRLRVDEGTPMLDVSVDLNKGLRSRSKGVGTYLDAKELSRQRLADFKSLKIDESAIVERIGRALNHFKDDVPQVWRLHVALEGDYWFNVRPEYHKVHDYRSLTLNVESRIESPPL